MLTVTLELACGRCRTWWMRWAADADRPFDGQDLTPAVNGASTVRSTGLGGYQLATDGHWYRWAPGTAAELPKGETYGRYEFTCPGCGHDTVRARVGKLEDAAETALRHLHDTRTPLLRTTPDKLLTYA